MPNSWKGLLNTDRRTDVCVRSARAGARDDLFRATDQIPCTARTGVESASEPSQPLVFGAALRTIPAAGELQDAEYEFWSVGEQSGCQAKRARQTQLPENLELPPAPQVCDEQDDPNNRLFQGCPYDFPVYRAKKYVGRHYPGSLVVRVAGQIVINQVPVVGGGGPQTAPGPRMGILGDIVTAELSPSANRDLAGPCTPIGRTEQQQEI